LSPADPRASTCSSHSPASIGGKDIPLAHRNRVAGGNGSCGGAKQGAPVCSDPNRAGQV
jgi:hypothetical protein